MSIDVDKEEDDLQIGIDLLINGERNNKPKEEKGKAKATAKTVMKDKKSKPDPKPKKKRKPRKKKQGFVDDEAEEGEEESGGEAEDGYGSDDERKGCGVNPDYVSYVKEDESKSAWNLLTGQVSRKFFIDKRNDKPGEVLYSNQCPIRKMRIIQAGSDTLKKKGSVTKWAQFSVPSSKEGHTRYLDYQYEHKYESTCTMSFCIYELSNDNPLADRPSDASYHTLYFEPNVGETYPTIYREKSKQRKYIFSFGDERRSPRTSTEVYSSFCENKEMGEFSHLKAYIMACIFCNFEIAETLVGIITEKREAQANSHLIVEGKRKRKR
jgi:hypothetical protein